MKSYEINNYDFKNNEDYHNLLDDISKIMISNEVEEIIDRQQEASKRYERNLLKHQREHQERIKEWEVKSGNNWDYSRTINWGAFLGEDDL